MPITNYPNGVGSFGVPLFGQGHLYDMPVGRVWFVCNRTGAVTGSGTAGTSRDVPFASIADAAVSIATTLPTLGDQIIVLAGHAENVTASNTFSGSAVNTTAVSFPTGTRIIGEGSGNQKPALTFTAAASNILFANAGCSLENFQILSPQSGVTTVASAITVTGANCAVLSCNFQMGTSATAIFTTGITIGAAANELVIADNLAWVGGLAAPTSWVTTTTTSTCRNVQILRNYAGITLSAAAGGVIDMSSATVTPPNDWLIAGNYLGNRAAASTVAIKCPTGGTGFITGNFLGIIAAASGATAISNSAGHLFWQDQNFGGNRGTQGIIQTPSST